MRRVNYDLGWATVMFAQRVIGAEAGACVIGAFVLAVLAADARYDKIGELASWAGALLVGGCLAAIVAALAQVIIEEVEDDD